MKFRLILLAAIFSTAMFAQVKPKVTSASIAYEKSDFAQAKVKIDEAEEELKKVNYALDDEKTMSKFYRLKGAVYFGILYSTNPEVQALDADALNKSLNGYTELLKYEQNAKKKRYSAEAKKNMPYLAMKLAGAGAVKADGEDFAGAKDDFLMAYEIQKNPLMGDAVKVDTSMLFNAAVMTMRAQDFAGAATIFQQVLDMGYTGIVWTAVDVATGNRVQFPSKAEAEKRQALQMVKDIEPSESVRNSTYISLISCYKQAGDTENFKKTLDAARKEYPGDVGLINLEIQDYLDTKEYDKALAILDEAIATSPENSLYYYVKGDIYLNQKKDDEQALAMYGKAIELKPDYTDALYMSGFVYFNRAKEITEEINALPGNAVKKYEALKKEQKETFKQSLPYFEKALETKPDDEDTLKALREVYYKIGDTENFKRVNEKLK
jgi:tetratricopeptide (TPR) repeat protein